MRARFFAVFWPLLLLTGVAAAQPNVWHVVNGVLTGPGFVSAGPILNGDGSASAPSYSFASDTDTGMYWENTGGTTPGLFFTFGGASKLRIFAGNINIASDSLLSWGSSGTSSADVSLSRGAANVLQLASGDYFAFGGVTSSQPALKASGTNLDARLADDSGYAGFRSNNVSTTQVFNLNTGAIVYSGTAPTISSGFGTSPSIANNNGTAAFTVNVGTGGTASSGVIALPTATNGWVCHVENVTATAANRANQRTVQTASTTTSVTVQNQTVSTGAALAWTASDVLRLICMAY